MMDHIQKPQQDETSNEENYRRFYALVCRHFVVLTGTYFQLDDSGKPVSGELIFTYSAFVMSFGGVWFLTTAGHVIKEINKFTQHKNIKIREFNLLDWTGTNAKHDTLIPFDYENAAPSGIYDKEFGVDFGYMILSNHDKRLLQANGIIAFEEKDWIKQPKDEDYVAYCVLGVPKQLVEQKLGVSITGRQYIGTLSADLLWLRRVQESPDEGQTTQLPRFVAEIADLGDLLSIEGMSGGPVFGLAKQDGRLKYWPVAVQSSWDKKTKTIYACPLAPFANVLQQVLIDHVGSGRRTVEYGIRGHPFASSANPRCIPPKPPSAEATRFGTRQSCCEKGVPGH